MRCLFIFGQHVVLSAKSNTDKLGAGQDNGRFFRGFFFFFSFFVLNLFVWEFFGLFILINSSLIPIYQSFVFVISDFCLLFRKFLPIPI